MRKEDNRKQGFKETVKEFREELLRIDRVTRVTAGGRQLRFRASVVIGDGKGQVGLGLGKAGEVVVAIEKAVRDAKKNLVKFEIANGTIAHDVTSNFKAASIMLHPASEGTGIIAGGAVRKVISVSGIKDILAKRYGCNNPITNARATIKALANLKGKATLSNKFGTKTEDIVETPVVEAVAPVAPKKEEKVEAPVVVTEEVASTEETPVETPVVEEAPVAAPAKAEVKAPAKAPAKKAAPAKAPAKKPAAKKK